MSLAATAVAATVVAARPAQAPAFRSAADLVSLYVTVTDARGNPIANLSKDDFTVSDDGQPQDVAVFSREPQPFAAVIALDWSGSMFEYRRTMAEAAAAFVDRLLPADRVRLGAFSFLSRDEPWMALDPPDFTGDRRSLIDALRAQTATMGGEDADSPVWPAIDRSLDALAGEPLRRVIVILSDGHDTPIAARDLGTAAADPDAVTTFDHVLQRVRDEEAMVYALGFTTTGPSDWSAMHLFDPPDPGLQMLAGVNGARYVAVDASSNFAAIFRQVVDELHSQYLVGFVPRRLDGAVHRIRVGVGWPGAKVRARRSYVAARR